MAQESGKMTDTAKTVFQVATPIISGLILFYLNKLERSMDEMRQFMFEHATEYGEIRSEIRLIQKTQEENTYRIRQIEQFFLKPDDVELKKRRGS